MELILTAIKSEGGENKNLKVSLVGGQTGESESLIFQIERILNNKGIKITEKNILGNKVRSVALDVATGQVSDYSGDIIADEIPLRTSIIQVPGPIILRVAGRPIDIPKEYKDLKPYTYDPNKKPIQFAAYLDIMDVIKKLLDLAGYELKQDKIGMLIDNLREDVLMRDKFLKELTADELIDATRRYDIFIEKQPAISRPDSNHKNESSSSAAEGAVNSPPDFIQNMVKELFERLKNKGVRLSGTVLDVETRDGRYIPSIANLGAEEVFGIDPDKEALDEAVNSGRLDKKHAICSKLEEWPREAESIDSIVVFNFIIPLNERNSFLKRALELLKTGGTLLISCAEEFTYEDVKKRLQSLNKGILNDGVLFVEYNRDFPNKYYLYVKKIEHRPSPPENDELGGIDFYALPIVTQQIKSLQSLVSSPLSLNPNLDFDKEWTQIQQIFNAGIRPSVQRLVEFSAAAASSPAESRRVEDVRGLIADLLRSEEEAQKLTPTDPALSRKAGSRYAGKGLLRALEI